MNTRAGYFRLGLFIIAGVTLIIVGVIALGGLQFLDKGVMVETYFDESVSGLDVGASVKRRGVTIGKVERITFVSDKYLGNADEAVSDDLLQYAPLVVVEMAIDGSWWRQRFRGQTDAGAQEEIDRYVRELGLRLRLASSSITGPSYIEADYVDPLANPTMEIVWTPEHVYIPSAPATLTQIFDAAQQIFTDLEGVDFREIATNLDELLRGANSAVNQADLETLSEEAVALLREARDTNRRLQAIVNDERVSSILGNTDEGVKSARSFIDRVNTDETSQLITDASAVAASARRTLEGSEEEVLQMLTQELPTTMASLQRTLERFDRLSESNSGDVEAIIRNVRVITEDLRDFAALAKRYPSQVLFGEAPARTNAGGGGR